MTKIVCPCGWVCQAVRCAAAMAVRTGQGARWRGLALGALMRSAPQGAGRKTRR